jgi:hypothetical protein
MEAVMGVVWFVCQSEVGRRDSDDRSKCSAVSVQVQAARETFVISCMQAQAASKQASSTMEPPAVNDLFL